MDNQNKHTRWFDRILPPYLLLPLALSGIIIIIVSLFLEYSSRRNDYLSMLKDRSKVFVQIILDTAVNTYRAATELENEITNSIFHNLNFIERIDRKTSITGSMLNDLIEISDFSDIILFDEKLNYVKLAGANTGSPLLIQQSLLQTVKENPLNKELYVITDTISYEQNYLAAIVNRENGGAIVGIINNDKIQKFRGIFGFGQILKSFAEEKSVEYVVLENEFTIIAGFFPGYQLSNFSEDNFLQNSFNENKLSSRVIEYEQGQVYETIVPFVYEGEIFGLIRLGLSMSDLEDITTRANRRMFIFSGLLVVIGFVLLNFSLTHRHRQLLKKELSYLSEYTNTILENLQSGVITIDTHGRIKVVNREASKILGRDNSEMFDKPFETLPDIFNEIVAKSISESKPVERKHNYTLRGSNDPIWLSLKTTVMKENEEDSCILLVENVTDQVQLEEQKIIVEKLTAMRKLASGVAHEIRNPLNSIRLIIDLLKLNYLPSSKTDKYIKHISTVQSEIIRISSIVEEFLKFAKPPELKKQLINFKEFFTDIEALYRLRLESAEISLEMDITSNIECHVDKNQLQQVIVNIMENAIQATEKGGNISIKVKPDGAYNVLTLSDTGIGISSNNLKQIFDIYFTTKSKGSGIGLAIVHQIITNHKGTISVESEENTGTKFTIKLPVTQN